MVNFPVVNVTADLVIRNSKFPDQFCRANLGNGLSNNSQKALPW